MNAAPGSPELQIAQANAALQAASQQAPVAPVTLPEQTVSAPLPTLPGPYAAQGTPQGSLTSNPTQATADTLDVLDAQKGLTAAGGEAEAEGLKAVADKQAEIAAEQQAQAADNQAAIERHNADYDAMHAQNEAAYNKFRQSAGSLKDPSTQYFEDKGQGSRVLAAFASFASGLGSGFRGEGENHFLNYLNKQIDNNYQAHKQNIDDLYNAYVASGKIVDTVENHNKFDNEARMQNYDLHAAHFKSELASYAARSQSALVKNAAQKAITDLDAKGIGIRQGLASIYGQQDAAKATQDRALQKEIRDRFEKSLEKHADLSPTDARNEAVKDLYAYGYEPSQLAPILGAGGVGANPETGELVFPKGAGDEQAGAGPAQATYQDGQLLVPSKDPATGKQFKPEERQKLADDARKRTVLVDGKPNLAVNEEAAKSFKAFNEAEPEAKRLTAELQDAFNKGDRGRYERARNEYIEIAPKLYGFTRGPSGAQAGESGAHDEGESKGTVAGQIPEFPTFFRSQTLASFANTHPLGINSGAGIAQAKLKGLADTLTSLRSAAYKSTFEKPPEEAKPAPDVAALAAKFGGKAL